MAKLALVIVLSCIAVWAAFVTAGCVPLGSSSPPSGSTELNVELGKTTPSDVQSQMTGLGFRLSGDKTIAYPQYQAGGITVMVFPRRSDGKVAGVFIRALSGGTPIGLAGVHVGDARAKVESVLGQATDEQDNLCTYKSPQPGSILKVMYSPTSGGVMIISFRLEGEKLPIPY